MSTARLAVTLTVGAALTALGLTILGSAGRGALPERSAGVPDVASSGHPTATLGAVIARPMPTDRVAPPVVDRPLVPGQFRQLTQGGCCTAAWWSDDSTALRFVDRAGPSSGTAIYAVAVWPPGSTPQVLDDTLSQRAGQTPLVVRQDADHTWVRDAGTGEEWSLPTGGLQLLLAPDGSRAVWWDTTGGWEHNDKLVNVHASDIYGRDVVEFPGLWGLDVQGWLSDNRRVLVVGRPARNRAVYALMTIDTTTGELRQLAKGSWLSDAALSAGGSYVAYVVSLDRDTPDNNGVWVVPTSDAAARRFDFVGAYRWRDDRRLVYIPMAPGAASHAVWQIDVVSGVAERLFDPATTPIRVAGNDWSISPDGQSLAFLAEIDRNIWLIDLPR